MAAVKEIQLYLCLDHNSNARCPRHNGTYMVRHSSAVLIVKRPQGMIVRIPAFDGSRGSRTQTWVGVPSHLPPPKRPQSNPRHWLSERTFSGGVEGEFHGTRALSSIEGRVVE